MGNFCGTDLYKQVKDKYKSQFTKFIITRHTIQVLDEEVSRSKRQITQKLTAVKQHKLQSIDHAATQINENYSSNKKLLDQKVPGGIKSVQKLKKAKIQQIMGYSYYEQKIKQLKINTSDKLDSIQKQLLLQIDQIHRYHRNKLVEDEPNLVLFNQLQPQVQRGLFNKGLEEFKEQVRKSQNHLKNSLGNKLNAKYHIDKIQNILPQQSIDGLINLSKERFENAVEILSPNGKSNGGMPKIF